MKPLEGKTAFVTGATRGIGQAIARKIGSQGATVIGTATSDAGAASISEDLAKAGITGSGMVLNVTDPQAIIDCISQITKQFESPTILVNNAGITRDNLMLRMKEDEWQSVMDTNLTSIFRVTKACLKAMTRARFGRIVNIGSVVGSSGNPGQANYAAAKAGIIGFSKSLAAELASRNITVNVVAPGFIDTDMTRELSDQQREELIRSVPCGRLGSPDDIANATNFLVSPDSGYVNGITLHVNGGMYMS